MTNFFEKRDQWGHPMALWVLVVMVFVAPIAVWSLKQIHLENDIHNWLPDDDPQKQILTWYDDHFHPEDRMFVSWEGSSLNDPRVSKFAQMLEGTKDSGGIRRGGLKQIKSVTTPQELISRMVDNKIEVDEAMRRLQGVMIGTGPLKIALTDAGRERMKTAKRLLAEQAQSELGLEIEFLDSASEWVPA